MGARTTTWECSPAATPQPHGSISCCVICSFHCSCSITSSSYPLHVTKSCASRFQRGTRVTEGVERTNVIQKLFTPSYTHPIVNSAPAACPLCRRRRHRRLCRCLLKGPLLRPKSDRERRNASPQSSSGPSSGPSSCLQREGVKEASGGVFFRDARGEGRAGEGAGETAGGRA